MTARGQAEEAKRKPLRQTGDAAKLEPRGNEDAIVKALIDLIVADLTRSPKIE